MSYTFACAGVAELADALDSKSREGNLVSVRPRPSAPPLFSRPPYREVLQIAHELVLVVHEYHLRCDLFISQCKCHYDHQVAGFCEMSSGAVNADDA